MAGWASIMCRAAETTTNAFALVMHSISVPVIRFISPHDAPETLIDPFALSADSATAGAPSCSNKHCFAVCARNLTMLEAVDLLCFLSDGTYTFGKGGVVVTPTNGPTVQLKQSAKKEQAIIAKLQSIAIPEITFRPPATVIDAIDFFFAASADYDDPSIPVKQRGINFAVKNPCRMTYKPSPEDRLPKISNDMIGAEEKPSISASSARFCTLYEALSLVCDKLDARFVIRDNTVVICPVANRLTGGNTPGESGVDKGRRTRHDGRVECPIVRGSGGD